MYWLSSLLLFLFFHLNYIAAQVSLKGYQNTAFYSEAGKFLGQYKGDSALRVVNKSWLIKAKIALKKHRQAPSTNLEAFFYELCQTPNSRQIFLTIDQAACNWGMHYNSKSILENKEFGSSLYPLNINGKVYYTYSIPHKGSTRNVRFSKPPKKLNIVATIHSHGAWTPPKEPSHEPDEGGITGFQDRYNSDTFSEHDYQGAREDGITWYVSTPSGFLWKYDPNNPSHYITQTQIIERFLPRDRNSPNGDRENLNFVN